MKAWFLYMVRCADGSLYTGVSTNVESRVKTHNLGKGAAYTRSRLPVELVYVEEMESCSEALKKEAEVKKLSKDDKETLVKASL
jgi:putative endonuclease